MGATVSTSQGSALKWYSIVCFIFFSNMWGVERELLAMPYLLILLSFTMRFMPVTSWLDLKLSDAMLHHCLQSPNFKREIA